MTIKQVMSPVTTKTPQSFRGLVDVDGTPLPVALSFVAAAVVLTVADEEIGRWSLGEIEFKATSDRRFEIHAEGDFLPFTPSDHDSFQSFIADPEPVAVEETVDEDTAAALDLGEAPLGPGADSHGSQLLAEAVEVEPDFGPSADNDPLEPDELTDVLGSSFQLPLAPGSRVNGSIELATDEESEDLLAESDPPDEYFAAGWHGPEGTAIPQTPTFRLAPVPPAESTPGPNPAPESSLGRRMGDFLLGGDPAAPASRPEIHPPSSAMETTPAETAISNGEPTVSPVTPPVATEPADTTELPPSLEEPTIPDTEDPQDWEPSPRNRLGGFVDRIEPSIPDPAMELTPPEPEAPSPVPAKSGGRLASAAEAIRNRVSEGGREQIEPSEKSRQWRLLAVAGAGFLVLLVGIIWGLAALLGGGDAAVAASSPTGSESPVTPGEPGVPDPAPVATAAPTTSTSTSTSLTTTTTVAPNPVAVTAGDPAQFVSDWNSIAAGYSASLTVAGTEFPVEANLSQSIRLTYSSDGLLTIAATPDGSASDQDILVAMGVVVAWAEPSLAPEQRKDVLASVGIDVTNPQLANMTGSSVRGGLEYRARVEGSTLYFSVGPVG